ncbi:GNAT family protein, partial [Streptomyces scabiei]
SISTTSSVSASRARAAADNTGSIRVLQKCGFVVTGHDRGFARARDAETDEVVLILRAV